MNLRNIPTCSISEAYRRFNAGEPMIDVREDDEWQDNRIEGAIHIPLGQLQEHIKEFNSEVLIICASGNRSQFAVAKMISGGVPAISVNGGMKGWISRGLPVVTD